MEISTPLTALNEFQDGWKASKTKEVDANVINKRLEEFHACRGTNNNCKKYNHDFTLGKLSGVLAFI